MPKNFFTLPPDRKIRPLPAAMEKRVDWSISFLGIPELWKQYTGKGVKIVIGDTGVDWNHPDIKPAIADAKDFTGSLSGASDRDGHGTFVTSQICASGDMNAQVALRGLLPDCKVFCAKCLGDNGSGDEDGIFKVFEYADTIDADIVSMSLGGAAMSEKLHQEILMFLNKRNGRFFVGAAGNDGRQRVDYPARWGIAVGAVDKAGKPCDFSNYGAGVDVFGPGFEILGCLPRTMGSYGLMSGTSQATPLVAAVLGLCLQKHREVGGSTNMDTMDEARAHLKSTSVNKGQYGIIDPAKLLDSIKADAPNATPTPEWVTLIEGPGPDGIDYRTQVKK